MNLYVKQISSLEKVLPSSLVGQNEIFSKTLLKGQSFNYQLALTETDAAYYNIKVTSTLTDGVTLYSVKNVIMDLPLAVYWDFDLISSTPGIMPDMLYPLEYDKNRIKLVKGASAIWVEILTSDSTPTGTHTVTITLERDGFDEAVSKTMTVNVLNERLPEQKIKFTQWFHVDCIADQHGVEIYSDKHWELIEKYMSLARKLGINMILTPVITPPLDTAVGTQRPCTQLVGITKDGDGYSFDYTLLDKWVALCKKCGIEFYEISHLFSQWGLEFAPNIKVKENGVEDYKFGWHVKSTDPQYKEFLQSFLPSLVSHLNELGIKDRCYFHVSDEPYSEHLDNYKYALELITPLIDDCKTFDALSHYDFYKQGLVKTPVCSTTSITPFLENKVDDLWAYYCCSQFVKVGNRFLAMPSYRNRILGLQLYKYDIKGFLQWGYNFYYSQFSHHKINPYLTTSADCAFPSGDAFSVYPITNDVVPSLRANVFKEALEDISVCQTLEKYIGREAVVKMIDDEAELEVTFEEYPRNSQYIPSLIEKMLKKIEELSE